MTENPINIRMIDHVVLRVSDVQAALFFYGTVLGCATEKVQETIGLYQLRAGQSLIDLVDVTGPLGRDFPSAPARSAPNMDHVCLQLDSWDIDAIEAHLRSHQIDFGRVQQRYGALGDGPSLYIADPEHNTVELKGPPAR
jgi:catechol 2,3-dioxygenase-like lactoylglutathione lyase family enzyme